MRNPVYRSHSTLWSTSSLPDWQYVVRVTAAANNLCTTFTFATWGGVSAEGDVKQPGNINAAALVVHGCSWRREISYARTQQKYTRLCVRKNGSIRERRVYNLQMHTVCDYKSRNVNHAVWTYTNFVCSFQQPKCGRFPIQDWDVFTPGTRRRLQESKWCFCIDAVIKKERILSLKTLLAFVDYEKAFGRINGRRLFGIIVLIRKEISYIVSECNWKFLPHNIKCISEFLIKQVA